MPTCRCPDPETQPVRRDGRRTRVIPKVFNGRDKLFFFVAYQGQRQVSTQVNSNVTTFTPAELTGDFSHSVKNGPDTNVVKFLQANPYYQSNPALAAQGIIDPARIDVVAKNYIAKGLIPGQCKRLDIAPGKFSRQLGRPDREGRLRCVTERSYRRHVEFGRAPSVSPFGSANVPGYGSTASLNRYHGVIDYSRIISPTMINDLRFTAQRNNSLSRVPATKQPTSTQLGINIISDNPDRPERHLVCERADSGLQHRRPYNAHRQHLRSERRVHRYSGPPHDKYGFEVRP